jgi:hypothetical protein
MNISDSPPLKASMKRSRSEVEGMIDADHSTFHFPNNDINMIHHHHSAGAQHTYQAYAEENDFTDNCFTEGSVGMDSDCEDIIEDDQSKPKRQKTFNQRFRLMATFIIDTSNAYAWIGQ